MIKLLRICLACTSVVLLGFLTSTSRHYTDKPSSRISTNAEIAEVLIDSEQAKENSRNRIVPEIVHTKSAAPVWLIRKNSSGKFLAIPVSP